MEVIESKKVIKSNKTKKPRCLLCNKKLKLHELFLCKCNNYYCTKHKLPEKHQCNFDFKKTAKEMIKKNNPLVVNNKVIKI